MKHATEGVLVKPPSQAELGYLAGIMDGEGYFSCSPKTNSFGLRVAMIDSEVIDWLHEHFAGNVSRAGLTKTGNRVHVWYLQRQRDLDYVLRLLLPHLVLKREQAEAMLALLEHLGTQPRWDTRPTSRCGSRERTRRREVRAEWVARRTELRAAVATARHVGVA